MFITKHLPQKGIIAGTTLLAVLFVVSGLTDLPTHGSASSKMDLWVVLGALASAVGLALVLARLRPDTAGFRLGDIKAQSLFRLYTRRLAPPAVAAALAASHTERVGEALMVFAWMLFASFACSGSGYPLHLSAVARFVFDLFMPALGIGLAILVSTLWGVSLQPLHLVSPLMGAWLVTFAGGWLEEVFNYERPIRMAVVGDEALARALALEINDAGAADHAVVGWVSDSVNGADPARRVGQPGVELDWLGDVDHLRQVVLEHEVDLLVMAPRTAAAELFQEAVESCVDLPVRLVQASRLYEEMYGRVPIGAINAAWFAYIMHPRFSPQSATMKRVTDLAIALPLAILLAPVMALVALAVKLGDRGPTLFRQVRVGMGGAEFNVLKFRTMRVNAEEHGVPQWATERDPRITPVGSFLRKTHLDELPQLLNVIGGSMSLVGPRPERPEFIAELEQKIPFYSRRVLVKPGITGWAQVRAGYSGSDRGTAFKLCHDLYYIKHRSFLFDLLTMVETLRTLVADVQYGQFTFSEAFILGEADVAREAEIVGEERAVLGETAAIAKPIDIGVQEPSGDVAPAA